MLDKGSSSPTPKDEEEEEGEIDYEFVYNIGQERDITSVQRKSVVGGWFGWMGWRR